MPDAANADQIAYWNAVAGETWANLQDRLDHQLELLGRRGMGELQLTPGQRALDIGCGTGQTTLALARAVGPQGAVLGVDISHPLLEVARRRAVKGGAANATFVEADAQTEGFEPASFDAAFSRFGVMFFADPVAAFRNIRSALKPGGRLAFVCWRMASENPVMTVAMAAATPYLRPMPAPADPNAPGPFAFADPERTRGILADAGFTEIAIAPHNEKVGGGNLDQTLELSLRVGPLGSFLRENPDQRDAAVAAVRQALAAHEGPDGVKLDSGTWIVSARA
jgi:ubiquinone/menaquinone biosynthesis C-methylase UbiE